MGADAGAVEAIRDFSVANGERKSESGSGRLKSGEQRSVRERRSAACLFAVFFQYST
jgi:hypothetical protein